MPSGKYFWTNKEFPANRAPSFHSSYGYIISQSKTTDSIVMCVRGNELMEPIFTEQTLNGDIVVTDSVTGLMWQKAHQTTSWMGALKYCKNSNQCGKKCHSCTGQFHRKFNILESWKIIAREKDRRWVRGQCYK